MRIVRCFLPVLFIASAAAFVLTGCTKTVDLLQYANVSITGESGDAEANTTTLPNQILQPPLQMRSLLTRSTNPFSVL